MPSLVPLVLPLSVLLASIMTFGDLAENYEFAAMKSAGISLQRAMRGLIIFILFLSFAAFFFANNVIPYAEYKFINFRKSIAQMKPAMAIAEGQFSDVGFYNIKVDKKSGENGNFLTGITIHKKTNTFDGSKNVIRAKNGELVSSDKSSILQLVLNDGFYYEDLVPKNYDDRKKLPFAKSSFKKYIIKLRRTLFLFDTVGVGIYTILGVQKSLELGVNPFAAVILGLVSAVFGGVIRDTLLNEIPLIFAKEIYATACIVGAILYTTMLYFKIEANIAATICMSLIIIIRIIAVKYKLALPKFDIGNETID
jgi:hypothetical protein